VAYLVAGENIRAARGSANRIRGGAAMVASCERGLNGTREQLRHSFKQRIFSIGHLIFVGVSRNKFSYISSVARDHIFPCMATNRLCSYILLFIKYIIYLEFNYDTSSPECIASNDQAIDGQWMGKCAEESCTIPKFSWRD
jgi:hypothetical protein